MHKKDWNGIIINWLIKGIKSKPFQGAKQDESNAKGT